LTELSKNYDYYDYFYCPNKNSCQISRIYKYEDASLHPSSESYEAELLRETALEKRKNRYKIKTKEFLKKYESVHKNIIEFKRGEEYLYYSEITKWCGYFNTVEDIGIFAFETEELATKFMDNFSEEFFFSPQEFCRYIWPYIEENYKKSFLENYSHSSYLKKGVWHRSLLCDSEQNRYNL